MDFDKKLRIPQSHLDQSEYQVDQLTQMIKELWEVVNTFEEAQDFKHVETANSSVSISVPWKQSVFLVFPVSIAAHVATFLLHGIQKVDLATFF